MSLAILRLKPKADYRLKRGHLWVYSNEVDVDKTPLKNFSPGEQVLVENPKGVILGVATINPNVLICARMISHSKNTVLNQSLFEERIQFALELRKSLFSDPYYRLLYGDADFLPGLVVDRFNDVLSVQINTLGMELHKTDICAALQKILNPRAIILKNNNAFRAVEGLPATDEIVSCTSDNELLIDSSIASDSSKLGDMKLDDVTVIENAVTFTAPLMKGQKTGWFYDHRINRQRICQYVKQKAVLDVYSYIGAWGVSAACAGANRVHCVDSSAQALEYVMKNAQLNGQSDKVSTLQGNAIDVLQKLKADKQTYDVVILDPPAFIKRRKDSKNGEKAYHRINQLAMQLINEGGILASASCSMHLPVESLRHILHIAGHKTGRNVQILEQGHQGPDHPIHPAIAETEYLKCFIARVI